MVKVACWISCETNVSKFFKKLMHRHNSWHMQYKIVKARQKSNLKRDVMQIEIKLSQLVKIIIVVMFYAKISCHLRYV